MRGWQPSHVSLCISAWNSSCITPDQGTTIVIDLWTTNLWWLTTDLRPVHDRPEFSQVMASKIRLTYEFKYRLATNLWLYPQVSRVCSRVGPRTYTYGREESSVWSLPGTCDPMSILCYSQVTRMSFLCDSAKVATPEKCQEWLATDLRPFRVTYDLRPTTNLWGTCNRHTSQPRVGHSGKVSRPFWTVPYGRGTCAERWRVPPDQAHIQK